MCQICHRVIAVGRRVREGRARGFLAGTTVDRGRLLFGSPQCVSLYIKWSWDLETSGYLSFCRGIGNRTWPSLTICLGDADSATIDGTPLVIAQAPIYLFEAESLSLPLLVISSPSHYSSVSFFLHQSLILCLSRASRAATALAIKHENRCLKCCAQFPGCFVT